SPPHTPRVATPQKKGKGSPAAKLSPGRKAAAAAKKSGVAAASVAADVVRVSIPGSLIWPAPSQHLTLIGHSREPTVGASSTVDVAVQTDRPPARKAQASSASGWLLKPPDGDCKTSGTGNPGSVSCVSYELVLASLAATLSPARGGVLEAEPQRRRADSAVAADDDCSAFARRRTYGYHASAAQHMDIKRMRTEERSRSPASASDALAGGLDSDASTTPAVDACPHYPSSDVPAWYCGGLEGLTPEQWSHLISVRTEFSDILREDFALNGQAERDAEFFRSVDAPLNDYSTRNVAAGSEAWQIRYRSSRLYDAFDSQVSSISPLEEVDADPSLAPLPADSVMSDHPHNSQWNYLLERTYDAPYEWTRFNAPRFASENAAFYASYDAATMVEELMAVGRGPPGPLFVSNPADWVNQTPGAPCLHGPLGQPSASSGTSPRVSAEVRHYWTMRAQGALADEDSRSSFQSSRSEPLRENISTWSQARPDIRPITKTGPSASHSGNPPGAVDDFDHRSDDDYEATSFFGNASDSLGFAVGDFVPANPELAVSHAPGAVDDNSDVDYEASSFFGNASDSLGFAVWDDVPANPELAVSQGVSDPNMSALFPRVTATKVLPSRMLGFPGPPPFGHFCSLWMLSRDIPAAEQVYDKNVCNLACSGVDSPSMLLQRCIDMWLAVASAAVEPQITQEALSICLRVISGLSLDDRLSFASEWSATILDSIFICDDDLPRRDLADKVLTDALETGGVPKGLWFQSDACDSSKVPEGDRPTRGLGPSPSSGPASKRSKWARKRIRKPVIALLTDQSFVDFVTPDHPSDEEMGGPAPEVSSGLSEAMTPSTSDSLSVAGVPTYPEVIDRYTTEERWIFTNVPSFPWPLDKVCFQMATRCSIPELTALIEPLMSSLRLLTTEEILGFEYGMALKELLRLYLVRRQKFDHAPCRRSTEIVLKAGFGRWKLNMTQGSPRWTFISDSVKPSSSENREIDINSSYETPVGGLAHLPDSCNASNIAAFAMSYCDLRRKRGEQKPFSDALWRVACGQFQDRGYDQEGTFMWIADLDQRASAFHPVIVQGQDLVSEICTQPFAEKSEVARPLNTDIEARLDPGLNTKMNQELVLQDEHSGPGRRKHANMEEIARVYWNDDTTTTLQARFMHSKRPFKEVTPNATEANCLNYALDFDCRVTRLRYRNNNNRNQNDNAWVLRSMRLRPPGVPTLLTHDEMVNATRRYITTAQNLDLSTFGGKLMQEVPALVSGEEEGGADVDQPPPIKLIHYMLNSNNGQLRIADAEWCLIPGPLDKEASSKIWQKDVEKGWGEYAKIESVTRALGDLVEGGHRDFWNCIPSLQIEADQLAGARPTPRGCSPLVGIYWQNKENFHWERKSNLVALKNSRRRGSKSKNKLCLSKTEIGEGTWHLSARYYGGQNLSEKSDDWMVSKEWMDCFLNSNGYLALNTFEERAMINKHLGMFLAATHFLTKTPSFIMDIQNIQGHPGYASARPGMRWRPQLDERVIVPLDSFPSVVQSYFKNPTGKWAQVDVFFRCNTTIYWVESVVDEPPREQGATGPEGSPEAGTQVGDGKDYFVGELFPFRDGSNYHWSEALCKSQYWCEAECGLILSASSQWEMTVRSRSVKGSRNGWACRHCNGGWNDKKTGSHFIQVSDGTSFLQIILDSPDKFLWNRWIMERANCMRLEPNEPPRIPAPTLANAKESRRCRFRGPVHQPTELDLLAALSIQGKKDLDFHS
ncbi:unnamed protein product, partial [Polarella glacialis]